MDSNLNNKTLLSSLFSVVLALVILVGTIPLSAFASQQDQRETADISLGESVRLGDSQKKDLEEIKISSEKELWELAATVNDGNGMKDNLVLITADITIESKDPWIPIGVDPEKPFSGHFDGQGHVISGFQIDSETQGGLFGYLYKADIRNLVLRNFTAPESTSGVFFHAYETSITLVKVEENGKMNGFALSARGSRSTGWDGSSTDTTWYTNAPSLATTYLIGTPNELAGLAELVNQPTNPVDFKNKTIVIAKDINLGNQPWTPIGFTDDDVWTASARPFKGHVVGLGDGVTISNIKIFKEFASDDMAMGKIFTYGLFGYATEGSFSNLVLDGLKYEITKDILSTPLLPFTGITHVGGLLGAGTGVDIKNITVTDADVNINVMKAGIGSNLGGVVGYLMLYEFENSPQLKGDSTLQNCLVLRPNLQGEQVGGLVGSSHGLLVSNSVVYGGTFSRPSSSYPTNQLKYGGIFGEAYMALSGIDATYTNLLSFNNTFSMDNSTDRASGFGAMLDATAITNSGVIGHNTPGAPIFAYLQTHANGGIVGMSYNFTDFPLSGSVPLIQDTAPNDKNLPYTINNYYDDIWSPTAIGKTLGPNVGLSTNMLTSESGASINPGSWEVVEGHYPINVALKNSDNPEIRTIAGLSSIAVASIDLEQPYTKSPGIKLMKNTPTGDPIHWELGYTGNARPTITSVSDPKGNYDIYTNENNEDVEFIISGGIQGTDYTKKFYDVIIVDTLLQEDVSKRVPAYDKELSPSTLERLETNAVITREFLDDIVVNPDVPGHVTLHTVNEGEVSSPVEAIPVNEVKSGVYEINGKEISLFFNLNEDTHYQIQFPEGLVVEAGKKDNVSEPYAVDFETPSYDDPFIKTPKDKNWSFYVETGVTKEELVDGITVWQNEEQADEIPFDASHYLVDPTWDSDDNMASGEKALKNTAFFPDDTNTVFYYIDSPDVLTNPQARSYSLIIMVKNTYNKTIIASHSFSLTGRPDWISEPERAVHIPWTRNKQAILDAALQGSLAETKKLDSNGNAVSMPAMIVVKHSEDALDQITLQNGGPAKLETTLMVLNEAGKPSSTFKEVTVYLDRELKYTMTPSPVTMSKATKRQVEERMNFVGRNFNHDIVEYDHWNNEYRKPGLYYIDVTSKPQHVTYCVDKDCPAISKHPYATLDDTFILNLIDTPGAEYANAWGEATAQAEENVYSQEIKQIKPTTYTLPKFVPEVLFHQEYGRLELNYGNEFRWNLYSSTLDDSYKWNDVYSLQVRSGQNPRVTTLLDNPAAAAQFEFAHVGRLFGTVEFDLNIHKAREFFTALPDENLGLYKFNPDTNTLDLVSDVIVTEGTWASATLKELYPTTYVLKARGENDTVIPPLEREITDYFISLREKQKGSNTIIDPNPTIINTFEHEKMFDSMYELIDKPMKDTTKTTGNLSILIALAVVVLAASGYFVYRRSTKKEEQ